MKKFIKYLILSVFLLVIIIIALGGGLGNNTNNNLIYQGKQPLVFAHRGYVNNNVENSISAFSKSDSLGFNAIETDVNHTKDGKLIIFHDKSCKRLLGINRNVEEVKWSEINTKPLLYKGKKTTDFILSLEQFLQQTDADKILYLDIKNTSKPIADSLINILNKHKNFKNIIIADGSILFLNYVKKGAPHIKTALEGFNKGKEWLYFIIPVNFKPDYYASFISNVDENHMKFLTKHNLINHRIVYGIDDKNLSKVFDFGLKNIIVNYSPSMGNIDSLKLRLNNDE